MSRAVRNATELSSAISSDDAACGADSDEEFRRPVASRKGNRQKRKRQASVPPDSSSKGCGNSASESSTGDADAWSEGSKEASDEMSSEDRGDPMPFRTASEIFSAWAQRASPTAGEDADWPLKSLQRLASIPVALA